MLQMVKNWFFTVPEKHLFLLFYWLTRSIYSPLSPAEQIMPLLFLKDSSLSTQQVKFLVESLSRIVWLMFSSYSFMLSFFSSRSLTFSYPDMLLSWPKTTYRLFITRFS